MPQISFRLDQAHQALDLFLTEEERERNGRPYSRTILDADGRKAVAVIIDPDEHQELIDAKLAFEDSQEPKDDDLPPGYRPYLHSPNATENRLLPTEPLQPVLAHAMYGKTYEDLDQTERDRVTGVAISCLLSTTLDTDSQGAVPILMLSHHPDDPEPRQFWQLAYKTEVDGLFLRATHGFPSEEWSIVTGSGFKLASGWWDRKDAGRAVAAIGRVLPFIDWMKATPQDLTDRSMKALRAVIRRYHFAGIREDQPEPEPLTDLDADTVDAATA